jgi:hypothetical protein
MAMAKNLLVLALFMLGQSQALLPHGSRTQEIIVPQQKAEDPAAQQSWATSNRLDASHTAPVELDKPMSLMCTLTNVNADFDSCTWTNGTKIYTVDTKNGNIEDESGDTVSPDLLEAVTTNEKSCHIKILTLTKEDMGDWVCRVEHTNAAANQFQEAVLVVTTDDRVTDGIMLADHQNITPSHYDLKLTPVMDNEEYPINGSVIITADVVPGGEPFSISLHINDVTIDESNVIVKNMSNGSPLTVAGHGYDSARQFYTIHLDSSVTAGNITISISFQSVLNNLLAGFYRSEYTEDGVKKLIASTQFQVKIGNYVKYGITLWLSYGLSPVPAVNHT